MKKLILICNILFGCLSLYAGNSDTLAVEEQISEEQMILMYQAYADSIVGTFEYETGEVTIGNGIAALHVPAGFKYLDPDGSETVLTNLWGNPPSEPGEGSLGMLFKENETPMSDSSFAINITYSEEGYVDDGDAKDIDYDDLLSSMQESEMAVNEQREELGYEPIHIVGWASSPFYDSENKKLHWAKELKFGNAEENTLNYSIRVLGRKGIMEMNVIGQMDVLDQVKNNIDAILPAVNFTEGNRYADFNPDIDEVAAYGIGGLIAGKVLAKAGFFALLAKFWKFILIGLIAAFAGVKKIFGIGGDAT